MDIGTAKPSLADQARVEHHLIDLVDVEEEFSVAEYQSQARDLLVLFPEVFLVGGSGLHFRSIVDPLDFPPTDRSLRSELENLADPVEVLVGADPDAGSVVDLANPRRVVRALEILELTGQTPIERSRQAGRAAVMTYEPFLDFRAIAIDPGEGLNERVDQRVASMREAGFWEEVDRLRHRLGRTAGGAVGYRQLAAAQRGDLSPEEGWDQTRSATAQLARRQRTFFRRDPRIDWRPWKDDLGQRIDDASRALHLK